MIGDRTGGVLLWVGGLLYGMNILTTHTDGGTAGVSLQWAAFFVLINYVYTYVFYKEGLIWSAWGSGFLAVMETAWLVQIIYYMGIIK